MSLSKEFSAHIIKPFNCDNCEKAFNTRSDLEAHKKNVHEKKDFLLARNFTASAKAQTHLVWL